ncbi:MAG: hypothetical protein IZT60_05635 [Gammaproteobacteria bacterium]|nr:hypothetical protein [Gammaproteobacteria bacterium]
MTQQSTAVTENIKIEPGDLELNSDSTAVTEAQQDSDSGETLGTWTFGPVKVKPPAPQKPRKPDRSTETLLRNTARANLELTALADNKANIMISLNGFILTVGITGGGFAIKHTPDLVYPFSVILLTALTSIFLAIKAVRPKLNMQHDTVEDLRQDRSSVAYFIHCANLTSDEYVDEMQRVVTTDFQTVQTHITRHLYGLGYGLKNKFKWLSWSYLVFSFGQVLSVLTFLGVMIFKG